MDNHLLNVYYFLMIIEVMSTFRGILLNKKREKIGHLL
jgi:hypothetical protein